MINTNLEKIVELAMATADDVYGGLGDGDALYELFELQLRRALMKEFCSSATTSTYWASPTITGGTYVSNTGTKELLRG